MKCEHCHGELVRLLEEAHNGEWHPRWMCDCTEQDFRRSEENVVWVHDPVMARRREALGIQPDEVANP